MVFTFQQLLIAFAYLPLLTNSAENFNKPRLLVIINRFVIGGQAADTIPLLHKLKEKFTIKIIYGEKEADEIEPLFLLQQYPGLHIEKIPSLRRSVNPFTDLTTLFGLYRLIKNYKPHIVHTHGAKSGLLGRLAAWLWGKAIIVHTFHGHVFHSYFSSTTTKIIVLLEKALAAITNAAIALSPSQQSELVNKFKIFPAGKIFEVPLGMSDPLESITPKENIRNAYNVASDQVIVAIVGRIVPIKNHFDFLQIAINILLAGNDNITFYIIGDGNERAQLQQFLIERKFTYSTPEKIIDGSRFVFTSWITDMYSVIDEIDIVVLTSSNEGTPVSLIEAQLSSKPVVAYNVGGVKDTFINNVSGYLVEKGDLEDFEERLIQLANDKDLRTSMGQQGKEFSNTKYSKAAEVAAIENLYTLLLKRHPKQ